MHAEQRDAARQAQYADSDAISRALKNEQQELDEKLAALKAAKDQREFEETAWRTAQHEALLQRERAAAKKKKEKKTQAQATAYTECDMALERRTAECPTVAASAASTWASPYFAFFMAVFFLVLTGVATVVGSVTGVVAMSCALLVQAVALLPHQAWRRVWGRRKRGRSRRYRQTPVGMAFFKRHRFSSGPEPLTSTEQCYSVGFFVFVIFLFTFLCLGPATIFVAALLVILIAEPVTEVMAAVVIWVLMRLAVNILFLTLVALWVLKRIAGAVGRNNFFRNTIGVAISVIRIIGGLALFWVVGPISICVEIVRRSFCKIVDCAMSIVQFGLAILLLCIGMLVFPTVVAFSLAISVAVSLGRILGDLVSFWVVFPICSLPGFDVAKCVSLIIHRLLVSFVWDIVGRLWDGVWRGVCNGVSWLHRHSTQPIWRFVSAFSFWLLGLSPR